MIKGIVEARKCPHCGHHEIGIRIQGTDKFVPLVPGQVVTIKEPCASDLDSPGDKE